MTATQLESKDESNEEPETELEAQELETESTSVNIKLPKPEKEPSVQDIFLDALMADIDGHKKEAQALYKKAAEFGYSEKNTQKPKTDVIHKIPLEDIIIGSAFLISLSFHKIIDPEFALGYIKKMAANHYPYAQVELGVYYANIEKNYILAFKYFTLSAKKGHPIAQRNLGVCYENGYGVSKNYDEAALFYERSAEQGESGAMHDLGNCYAQGFGVKQNDDEAFKWYKLAADKLNPNGLRMLGICYAKGREVKKDDKEALKYYELSAALGNEKAMLHAGVCYESGVGITKNLNKSFEYFKSSAELGNLSAKINLIECYYEGYGTEKNFCEAKKLLDFVEANGFKYPDGELLSNIKKDAQIEGKIKVINKIISKEVNAKDLETVRKFYQECSSYIDDTGIVFGETIARQFKEVKDFLKTKEAGQPSITPLAASLLQQNNSKDKHKI